MQEVPNLDVKMSNPESEYSLKEEKIPLELRGGGLKSRCPIPELQD